MHAAKRFASTGSGTTSEYSRLLRVKVTREAKIYCNGRLCDLRRLDSLLAKAAGRHETIVYYREAPSFEASPDQMEIVDHVVAAGAPIIMGHQAPSEWGQLDWLEMLNIAGQFQLGIVPERQPYFVDLLFGDVYVIPIEASGGRIRLLLDRIDRLISGHRLVEIGPSQPDLANNYDPDRPGFYLRFAFDTGIEWASFYEPYKIPYTLQAFGHECRCELFRVLSSPECRMVARDGVPHLEFSGDPWNCAL